ncbi:bromodomain-containing protein [Rhizophagus clarus]|uniref:Bromodomain-containing protein n=1 Tax=Rhizophagus clarus TaxID=94130 RepID=A0A8H3QKN4_9GLOM|nr:bromodomain-containing protein [Rhizophagus clarus]
MSTSNNYPGQNILISYLKKRGNKSSYHRFLNLHYDTIVTSTILDNWKDLNNALISHFMKEVEKLGLNQEALKKRRITGLAHLVINDQALNSGVLTLSLIKSADSGGGTGYLNADNLRYAKELKIFWQRVIKEHHEKENLLSTVTTVTSCPIKKSNIEFTNFCYGILHELENKTCAHSFYKYVESNKNIKYPIDLFTINSKLKNDQYASLSEFEEDIRQIFCNCYTYNNVEIKQKGDLKRVRDDTDTDNLSTEHWKKQSRILEQNKDNLVYKQVVDSALLIASSYESLVNGDIIPFINILKNFLLKDKINKLEKILIKRIFIKVIKMLIQ